MHNYLCIIIIRYTIIMFAGFLDVHKYTAPIYTSIAKRVNPPTNIKEVNITSVSKMYIITITIIKYNINAPIQYQSIFPFIVTI